MRVVLSLVAVALATIVAGTITQAAQAYYSPPFEVAPIWSVWKSAGGKKEAIYCATQREIQREDQRLDAGTVTSTCL
jgi:predicted S18 family serine protease